MFERKLDKNIAWIKKMDILKENKELILKFDKERKTNQIAVCTRIIFLKCMRQFCNYVNKPFKEVTKDDIIDFLDKWRVKPSKKEKPRPPALTSINNMKHSLRLFFKWLNHPEPIKDLKIKPYTLELKGKLLDQEQIDKLISVCDNSRDRALLIFMLEAGVRLSELLSIKIGDFKLNKVGAWITVKGKTGERTIPIVRSVPHIVEYLRTHPYPDDENYPLWISTGKNYGKPLKYNSVRTILQKLKRRSGITKRVWIHGLRHQSVLEKKTYLTEPYQRRFYGWSATSDMPFKYGGISDIELEKRILENSGIETEKIEKDRMIRCVRCGLNNPDTDYCMRCNYPLKPEEHIKIEEKRQLLEEKIDRIDKLLRKQPKLLKMLEGN